VFLHRRCVGCLASRLNSIGPAKSEERTPCSVRTAKKHPAPFAQALLLPCSTSDRGGRRRQRRWSAPREKFRTTFLLLPPRSQARYRMEPRRSAGESLDGQDSRASKQTSRKTFYSTWIMHTIS